MYRRLYDLGEICNDTFELLDGAKAKVNFHQLATLKIYYRALM
jgi:hypothetical protein